MCIANSIPVNRVSKFETKPGGVRTYADFGLSVLIRYELGVVSVMKLGIKAPTFALVLATSTALFSGCAAHRYGGETAQDVAVSKAVQTALANDTIYSYPQVEVYTAQGTTELKGYVDCWEKRERAKNFAMFTKGVRGIQNDILQQQ